MVAAAHYNEWARMPSSSVPPPSSTPTAALEKRKLRILVAKPGLDGHDRGAKVVARALADAGYEVVYTGLHQTPDMIAATAVQEAVDAVGLSIMSGAHMTLFPAVMQALEARGADDVLVFGGGIVPEDDVTALAAIGVAAIFTPGASTRAIIEWIENHVRPHVEANRAAERADGGGAMEAGTDSGGGPV